MNWDVKAHWPFVTANYKRQRCKWLYRRSITILGEGFKIDWLVIDCPWLFWVSRPVIGLVPSTIRRKFGLLASLAALQRWQSSLKIYSQCLHNKKCHISVASATQFECDSATLTLWRPESVFRNQAETTNTIFALFAPPPVYSGKSRMPSSM